MHKLKKSSNLCLPILFTPSILFYFKSFRQSKPLIWLSCWFHSNCLTKSSKVSFFIQNSLTFSVMINTEYLQILQGNVCRIPIFVMSRKIFRCNLAFFSAFSTLCPKIFENGRLVKPSSFWFFDFHMICVPTSS